MEMLYKTTLVKFDKLFDQLSKGTVTLSEYYQQRLMVLSEFSIGIKDNYLQRIININLSFDEFQDMETE
jgi:hypothetical protein